MSREVSRKIGCQGDIQIGKQHPLFRILNTFAGIKHSLYGSDTAPGFGSAVCRKALV